MKEQDLVTVIEKIVAATEKGESVSDIAKKLDYPEDETERIVRIYLTHPGVDIDGILWRLGV